MQAFAKMPAICLHNQHRLTEAPSGLGGSSATSRAPADRRGGREGHTAGLTQAEHSAHEAQVFAPAHDSRGAALSTEFSSNPHQLLARLPKPTVRTSTMLNSSWQTGTKCDDFSPCDYFSKRKVSHIQNNIKSEFTQ